MSISVCLNPSYEFKSSKVRTFNKHSTWNGFSELLNVDEIVLLCLTRHVYGRHYPVLLLIGECHACPPMIKVMPHHISSHGLTSASIAVTRQSACALRGQSNHGASCNSGPFSAWIFLICWNGWFRHKQEISWGHTYPFNTFSGFQSDGKPHHRRCSHVHLEDIVLPWALSLMSGWRMQIKMRKTSQWKRVWSLFWP